MSCKLLKLKDKFMLIINDDSDVDVGNSFQSKDFKHLKKMLREKKDSRKLVQTKLRKKMNRYVQEISEISSHLKRLER